MAWGTCTFNNNGGVGGPSVLYYNYTTSGSFNFINYWATQQSTSTSYRIANFTPPTRDGFEYAGYACTGFLNGSGLFKTGYLDTFASSTPGNTSAVAMWVDHYAVNLDANGGSGGTSKVYLKVNGGGCFSDPELTHPVTKITPPTNGVTKFLGFRLGGVEYVDREGNISQQMQTAVIHGDITLTAAWGTFGNVTDYFGLGSDTLVPISSEGGENRQHVVSYNASSEAPATETSGVWMNPRVTYEVAGSTTLDVTLGNGFAGQVYNSGSTHRVDVTGYMIAAVEIHAAIGEPVRVTVSAVANEGFTRRSGSETMTAAATDAIKTYRIVANLSPRHRPQDVMNALSLNGFDMQEITTVATCDPVVVVENGVPCASDVCHGRLEVSATLADYGDGESFSPNTGWVVVGEPVSLDGVGYKKVTISARKELT